MPEQSEEKRRLTKREKEVVTLIASGLSSRQVAATLGLAFKTAVVHRYNAMQKMKVNNVIGLMREAIRMGLVQSPKRGSRRQDIKPGSAATNTAG